MAADYAWPWEISTGVTIRYVGDAFDNAANSFVLNEYILVDLRASWQVTETVEVYGRVENIFNEDYVTTRNYGTTRRGVFAGVRTKF
jgi:vitamin B12 transporter